MRKHNVELLPNPIDRRSHWVKIAAEYNKARGTNLNHQSLSKKLANMKQRDRQKVMAEKKKNFMGSVPHDVKRDYLVTELEQFLEGYGSRASWLQSLEVKRGSMRGFLFLVRFVFVKFF